MNEPRITRVSAKDMKTLKGRTDWQRLRSMTEAEITARAEADADAQPTSPEFWKSARLVMPPQGKKQITLRLDADVVAWFKSRGERYQTRMNAVLRAYMEAQRR